MKEKKRIKILIVDDEVGIRELLSEILTDEGYSAVTAHDADSAYRARIEEMPDLILLDIWMPDLDGITLMKQWEKAGLVDVPVIIMSGHATIDTAVEATRLGAIEVLEKPIATGVLLNAVSKGLSIKRRNDVNPRLRQLNLGQTGAMVNLKKELMAASTGNGPVLMVGPPNCGAVFFAQFLARPNCPIMHIDNGVRLEGNVNELLRRAEDGVIIVRLVDVFNVIQQNGLLGLLREAARVDIRVVACSMEPPAALMEKSGFSEKLAAMLSQQVIMIPPLIKWRDDIPVAVSLICRQLSNETDLEKRQFTPAAMQVLVEHIYEDDFAELMSIVRSALMFAQDEKVDAITVRAIIEKLANQSFLRGISNDIFTMTLRDAREIFEREYFSRVIALTNGDIQRAAQISGLERTYFYRKLKQYKEEKSTD